MFILSKLPNSNSIFRIKPHAIIRLNIKCSVEIVLTLNRDIYTSWLWCMNVNLHFSFNCFWTLLLHPASCIIFKQVFQINIVVLTSLNSTSKPCQVSNIFSYYLLTVNLSWTVLQAIKNINNLANPLIDSAKSSSVHQLFIFPCSSNLAPLLSKA